MSGFRAPVTPLLDLRNHRFPIFLTPLIFDVPRILESWIRLGRLGRLGHLGRLGRRSVASISFSFGSLFFSLHCLLPLLFFLYSNGRGSGYDSRDGPEG